MFLGPALPLHPVPGWQGCCRKDSVTRLHHNIHYIYNIYIYIYIFSNYIPYMMHPITSDHFQNTFRSCQYSITMYHIISLSLLNHVFFICHDVVMMHHDVVKLRTELNWSVRNPSTLLLHRCRSQVETLVQLQQCLICLLSVNPILTKF